LSQEKVRQIKFFLDVVPDEYLIGIIDNKKYAKNELKKMLEIATNKKVVNPKKVIRNLSHQDLINLFVEFEIIPHEDAKNYYLQFRDSKNPIFYLYKLQNEINRNLTDIKEGLNGLFSEVKLNKDCKFIPKSNENEILEMDSEYKYKDFTMVNSRLLEENTILEISYEYLERIDYISKNYIPKSVYTLKSGFFWLDEKNQLVIIKCQNTSINEAIISILGEYFNTKYWKFSLRKDIVDDIFDKSEMIKNSLIANKSTDPDLFNSIVIKDIEFERKSKDPRFKFIVQYERRSSSYRTNIKGFQNKVKVDIAENGKISLVGKSIKIDRCREWLINILVQILTIHQKYLDSSDISSIIRTSDFTERTSLFKKVKNKKAREKIFELIEKIVLLKNNPTISNVEYYFPTNYAYYFREFLIPFPDLRCSKDECNTCLLCPNEACDSFKFEIKIDIKKRKFYLKCSKCNEEISQTQNLECIDNHNVKFNLENSLNYVFNLQLKIELNNILQEFNTGFKIKNDIETFYIKENKLYRKKR